MSKYLKHLGLSRAANSYVEHLEQAQKLRDIANRFNYPYKVKILHEKIKEEYDFWYRKQAPLEKKLLDLSKDLKFVETQVNVTTFDKEKIDLLMKKYGFS